MITSLTILRVSFINSAIFWFSLRCGWKTRTVCNLYTLVRCCSLLFNFVGGPSYQKTILRYFCLILLIFLEESCQTERMMINGEHFLRTRSMNDIFISPILVVDRKTWINSFLLRWKLPCQQFWPLSLQGSSWRFQWACMRFVRSWWKFKLILQKFKPTDVLFVTTKFYTFNFTLLDLVQSKSLVLLNLSVFHSIHLLLFFHVHSGLKELKAFVQPSFEP